MPSITVVIPARDEVDRVEAAVVPLVGAPAVSEIVVVDDGSIDDTAVVASAAGARVLRVECAAGWAGKTGALQHGLERATGEWVVLLDADTRADPRLPLAAVQRARSDGCDLASVAARVRPASLATTAVHGALLATVVARFGAPGGSMPNGRELVSGQCIVLRRTTALDWGGFAPVADSTVEDVALARHLTETGRRVGFLDGTDMLTVESYGSFRGTVTGWGRSIGLPGVDPVWRRAVDAAVAILIGPLVVARLLGRRVDVVDVAAVSLRLGIMFGAARAFERPRLGYWLSPVLDPVAAGVLAVDLFRRRTTWRGRVVDRGQRPARTEARSGP